MAVTDIIKSVNIDDILAHREAFIKELKQTAKHMEAAEKIYIQSNIDPDRVFEALPRERFTSYKAERFSVEEFTKGFDATAWDHLMKASGMLSFMNASSIETWREDVIKKRIPELTKENILTTFQGIYDKRLIMLESGILSVFRALSYDYKSNNPVKFGKKIIREKMCSDLRIHQMQASHLDDLERFMHIADGKPQPDTRTGFGSAPPHHETDYLETENFQNGNVHIKFKRPDLVDKMNAIIGKHFPNALPPPTGK